MSKSLTVRLTARRSKARRAPISYTPPVNPPPPRTKAVLSPRPRRLLPLLPRGLPSEPSNSTTFPMGEGIMAARQAGQPTKRHDACRRDRYLRGRGLFEAGARPVRAERMRMLRHKGAIAIALLTAALSMPASAAHARPQGPDKAFRTPVAHGAAAAHTAVSRGKLTRGLAKLFRKVGKSGAFVFDPGSH